MDKIKQLTKEREELLKNNNPDFIYMIIACALVLLIEYPILNLFPQHSFVLGTIKIILFLIGIFVAVLLPVWIINKCMLPKRIAEIDKELTGVN